MANVQLAVAGDETTQVILSVPGVQGPAGSNLPPSGTTNQVLYKQSSTDYDTAWSLVTSAMITDGTIVNGDINASAAIAGTKISPDFGSQNVVTTGTATAASFIPTSSGVPTNGLYLPSANNVAISTNGTGKLFVDASGNVGVGTASPTSLLHLSASALADLRFTDTGEATDQKNWVWQTGTGIGAGTFRLRVVNDANSTGENAYIVTRSGASAETHQWLTAGSERLRITSAGTVNIVGAGSAGSTQAVSFNGSAPVDSLVLTSGGLLGIGTSTLRQVAGATANLQNERTGAEGGAALSLLTNSSSGVASQLTLGASRGAAGTPTSVLSTDIVGTIDFFGADGTDYDKIVASVRGRAIGTITSDRVPGQLEFYTAENDAGNALTQRLTIDNQGNVGIGTTSPGAIFQTKVATNYNIAFNTDNDGVGRITCVNDAFNAAASLSISGSDLRWQISGQEKARLDSSGRLLVGTSNGVGNNLLQVKGSTVGAGYPGGAFFNIGLNVASVDADFELGRIDFGNQEGYLGASIVAAADLDWNASDYPSRLVFSTTADGVSSPTERMRISENGTVTINGPGGGTFLNLKNSGGYSGFHEVDNTAYTIGQNSDLRAMRIGSGANWLTTGVNLAPGGTSWGTYSDERLKTDIVELTDCLDDIKGIRCVSYRLTDVDDANSKKRIGVIAQDLVGKYDEAINASRRSENDETEYLSVQYSDLIPVLLKALQEASVKIESLEARLTAAGI